MKKKSLRLISILLTIVMLVGMLPVTALAQWDQINNQTSTTTTYCWNVATITSEGDGYSLAAASGDVNSTDHVTVYTSDSMEDDAAWTELDASSSASNGKRYVKIVPNDGYYVQYLVVACNDNQGTSSQDGLSCKSVGNGSAYTEAFDASQGTITIDTQRTGFAHDGRGSPYHILIQLAKSPNPVCIAYEAGDASVYLTGTIVDTSQGDASSTFTSGSSVAFWYQYDNTTATPNVLEPKIKCYTTSDGTTYEFTGWKAEYYSRISNENITDISQYPLFLDKLDSDTTVSNGTIKLTTYIKMVAQWEITEKFSVSGTIDHGTITTGNAEQLVASGASSTAMTFTPAENYHITQVKVNNNVVTDYELDNGSYTYPATEITENTTVAVFTELDKKSLTVNSDDGVTNIKIGDEEYTSGTAVDYGAEVTITWELDNNLEIETVTVQSGNSGAQNIAVSENSCKVTITEDTIVNITTKTKTANYTVEYYYQNEAGNFIVDNEQSTTHTENIDALVSVTEEDKNKTKDGTYLLDESQRSDWSATLEPTDTVLKVYYKLILSTTVNADDGVTVVTRLDNNKITYDWTNDAQTIEFKLKDGYTLKSVTVDTDNYVPVNSDDVYTISVSGTTNHVVNITTDPTITYTSHDSTTNEKRDDTSVTVPQGYSITVNLDNGTWPQTDNLTWNGDDTSGYTATMDSSPISIADPEKANYTFLGWSMVENTDDKSVTFTANWTPSSNNKPNAPSGEIAGLVKIHCTNANEEIAHADETYSLTSYETDEVAGNDVAGYTCTVSATVDIDSYLKQYNEKYSGHDYTDSEDTTNEVELTLKYNGSEWVLNDDADVVTFNVICQATVTFDYNYDGSQSDRETVDKGNTVTAPTEPTREGYDFDGWYTIGESGKLSTAWDFASDKVTKDITLYAKWTQRYSYEITVNNGNYRESDGSSTASAEDGDAEKTIRADETKTFVFTPDTGYDQVEVKVNGEVVTEYNTHEDGTITYEIDGSQLKKDVNIVVTYSQKPTTSTGTAYVNLNYETNGGEKVDSQTYSYGSKVVPNGVTLREGYQFLGWYLDEELTTKADSVQMNGDVTVYADWIASTVPDMLNGDDHYAYIVGLPDGTVNPEGNITRAEVATIFFRLLKDEVREEYLTKENNFKDVSENAWYCTAVSTLAALGIVQGKTATTFDPNAYITRAELATICARFDTGVTSGDSSFSDISGHWAEEYIEKAATLGWVLGCDDGTFRPNQNITRAETMTMINRVLCRIPESTEDLSEDMTTWPDNANTEKWYYLAVQEATNSHDYAHKGETNETWTALREDPDWLQYEK